MQYMYIPTELFSDCIRINCTQKVSAHVQTTAKVA